MCPDFLDAYFPRSDGVADTEATISCPYCGALTVIGLDPGSGVSQEYVEDCEVCCRPCLVVVRYHEGAAEVRVEAEQDIGE